MTRNTGDNGDVQLCPLCYEKASYGNSLADAGFKGDPWKLLDTATTIAQVHEIHKAEMSKLNETTA